MNSKEMSRYPRLFKPETKTTIYKVEREDEHIVIHEDKNMLPWDLLSTEQVAEAILTADLSDSLEVACPLKAEEGIMYVSPEAFATFIHPETDALMVRPLL